MHITLGEALLYVICFAAAVVWLKWVNKHNFKKRLEDETKKRALK